MPSVAGPGVLGQGREWVQLGGDTARIVSLFPNHAFVIRRHLPTDARLRALCEDYLAAHDALRHWQVAQGPLSRRRRIEYFNLVIGLEREIRGLLGERRGSAHRGG